MLGTRWIVSAALALAMIVGAPAPASADDDTAAVEEAVADPGREAFDLAVSRFRSGLVSARATCRLEREEPGAIVTRRGEARTSECQRLLRELRATFLEASREARELSHAFRMEQKRLAEERRRVEAERKLAEETARVEREKGEERAKVELRRKLVAEQARAEKARAEKAKAEQVKRSTQKECMAVADLTSKRTKLIAQVSELQSTLEYKRSEQAKYAAQAREYLEKAATSDGETRVKYLEKAAAAETQALEWAHHAEKYAALLAEAQRQLAALPVSANHDDGATCDSTTTTSKKRASLEQQLGALEEKIALKRAESGRQAARAVELLAQADSLTGDLRAKYLLKAADAERLAAEYAASAREYEAKRLEVLAALEKLNSSGS